MTTDSEQNTNESYLSQYDKKDFDNTDLLDIPSKDNVFIIYHACRRSVEHFLNQNYTLPSYQGWSQDMKCWARRCGLSSDGMSVKTTRKTAESWLMFTFPDRMVDVMLSMGHNMTTSVNHYLGMPFDERDRLEMLNYVVGWI